MYFIQYLGSDPLQYLIALFLLAFGFVLHNVCQALLANAFGDPTAKQRGFTTTGNPMLHLDSFSWIWMAIFGFAIPSSIPVRLYSRQQSKEALVWLIGPISMMLFAFIILLVTSILLVITQGNDSFASLLGGLYLGFQVLTYAAVMYLFPIPPLDGARALFAVGSPSVREQLSKLERWMAGLPFSFMLIFFVLSVTGILRLVLTPIYTLMYGILQVFGLPIP